MQLVIDKPGASLKVKDGQFCVRYDGERQMVPIPKVKSILLNPSCLISAEAIARAVEREIDILFLERGGKPYARIWSPKYGSIATIRKNQLAFSQSSAGMEWVRGILLDKIDNQRALLLSLNRPDFATEDDIADSIEKLEPFREKIAACPLDDREAAAASLRGWEGNASRIYFGCISRQLPEAYRFERRSKRPARDMFNCLLNYAYGIFYSVIEGALIRAGIDPYVGVMHRDEYNRPVMVYDLIERYRVWADFPVVDLCRQQLVFPEFFDIEADEYWLNEHGKRLLIPSVNEYLDEVVPIGRISRTRRTHIFWQAEQLAAELKTFNHV
jgi:CRISPR-associated protein Cas1